MADMEKVAMAQKDSVVWHPSFEETPRASLVIELATTADDITPWGSNPWQRDRELRAFWPTEPFLASAVYSIVARNAAFSWRLDGPPRTVKAVHSMLHEADSGKGWLDFIIKLTIDLFTCDNGAFIEVVKAGEDEGSPVVGINHLDSGRCRRTGVLDWPVVYTDRRGQEHKLRPWQVITVEDFPSPIETYNSAQICTVSRILRMAQLLRDISIHMREKASGANPKAIHLVANIDRRMLEDALKDHRNFQVQQGYLRYVKPLILSTFDPSHPVSHEQIDIASLPDGFNFEEMMRWYITVLAMAFGADYQDFAPMPARGLGTSTQSLVLHMKSRGKGPALFMKNLEHKFNFYGVMPRNVTFRYDEQDIAEDMEMAEVRRVRAETHRLYVDAGILTPEAARQQMLDQGDLDSELFDRMQTEPDVTIDVSLEDAEKPESEEGQKAKPRRPDFMKRERLEEERGFEAELLKAFGDMFAEVKRRVLTGKSRQKQEEPLPFADLLADEDLWRGFRVKVLSAAAPRFRNGAMRAAQHNFDLGLAVDMDKVNAAVLDFVRGYTNPWWVKLEQTTRDGLRGAITAWQETGLGKQGLPDLIDAIEPLFGEARAKRVAVTEVTRLFDEGNRLARLEAGIETEEWQTSEDELVCTQYLGPMVPDGCAGLDGMRFPTASGPRPVTDTHVNCRCARLPVANNEVVE